MVNSHYIPQFVLRNFCLDDKIQYYDTKTGNVESRSTRSVFSEKGYYPDNIEKALCQRIESQFANILKNKILNGRYQITLNSIDMLILKKYLIITMLRVRDDNLEKNIWYHELKRSEVIPEDNPYKEFFSGDFYENINNVLESDNLDTLLECSRKNLNLFTFVKDVVYSYNVFAKSNNCKEDFLINDRGWACYRGPMGVKKLNAMMTMLEIRYDPFIDMWLHMSSPQDYAIYPLSNTLVLICMSPAFKMCLPGAPYNIIYPDEAPSLSKCLGFGSPSIITPCDNRFNRDGTKEYIYKIQQLSKNDVCFLNGLLIKNTDKYLGYADKEKVKSSLKESGKQI